MSVGPFAIGSATYPGLSKLVEEMGEVGQVVGKLMATGGDRKHWDGSDLRDRLIEELADLSAAIQFVTEANDLARMPYLNRVTTKAEMFRTWHDDPTNQESSP